MSFFVYILYSKSHDRFYIGQTQEINNRLNRHNSRYEHATSPYVPWELRWFVEKENRSDAMALEKKLKNLNREKLLLFITKYA